MIDNHGNTPLHLAATTASTTAGATNCYAPTTLKRCGMGCGGDATSDSEDGTMVYDAGWPAPLEQTCLQLITDEYPEALWTPNHFGQLPLHLALFGNSFSDGSDDENDVEGDGNHHQNYSDDDLSTKERSCSSINCNNSSLMLSYVSKRVYRRRQRQEESHRRHEIVSFLIRQYPHAARHRDNHGCLPLHYALIAGGRMKKRRENNTSNRPTTMTLDLLDEEPSKQSPPTIMKATMTMPVTFHDKLQQSQFDERTNKSSYRNESTQKDNSSDNSSTLMMLERILNLVDTYPESIQLHDMDGWYPFQRAGLSDQPLDVVYFLVRRGPHLIF